MSKEEVISADEGWLCEKCDEVQPAKKTDQIFSVGRYLIIHFKRFTEDGKISTKVEYPLSLNMEPYIRTVPKTSPDTPVVPGPSDIPFDEPISDECSQPSSAFNDNQNSSVKKIKVKPGDVAKNAKNTTETTTTTIKTEHNQIDKNQKNGGTKNYNPKNNNNTVSRNSNNSTTTNNNIPKNTKITKANINTYNLLGAILHRGTLNRGHYTCICRSKDNKSWVSCNDNLVQ
jgi:ubiquitin C-terminal hydrolase